jgi:hypothetical protein
MRSLGIAVSLLGLVFLSCAPKAQLLPAVEMNFFVPAPSDNPWTQKIQNWQARHHLDPVRRGEEPRTRSPLGDEYSQFSAELRRDIAVRTIQWVQENSRQHYRPDGERDHWATLSEVIESGGDDCDGLDLLTFELLRKLGFGRKEIYRAIVVEDGTGQHHMVTLWFENGTRDDPFVLDPTGVVTDSMTRLSQIPSWEPIEIFDEQAHFRVEHQALAVSLAD